RAAGTRRDEPAVERVQRAGDLIRRRGEPGHHLGGGEREDVGDGPRVRTVLAGTVLTRAERVRDDAGDRAWVPAGLLHGLDEFPGPRLDRVGRRTVVGALGVAERLAQAGQRLGLAAPHLPGA